MKDVMDCRVLAHRGASAYAPENTLAAFALAIDLGADMIELDITRSRDGEIVVIHDDTLDRTTNGRGRVERKSYRDLAQLDAGCWFSDKFKGEKIPLLQEVLELCEGVMPLNIEIKTEAVRRDIHKSIEPVLLELLCQYGMTNDVIISSFNHRAIERIKRMDPDVKTAALFKRPYICVTKPSFIIHKTGADMFNCNVKAATRSWLDDAKAHDIKVNVYTVDDSKKMRQLVDDGVWGIFSNKCDVLKQVVYG